MSLFLFLSASLTSNHSRGIFLKMSQHAFPLLQHRHQRPERLMKRPYGRAVITHSITPTFSLPVFAEVQNHRCYQQGLDSIFPHQWNKTTRLPAILEEVLAQEGFNEVGRRG